MWVSVPLSDLYDLLLMTDHVSFCAFKWSVWFTFEICGHFKEVYCLTLTDDLNQVF